MIKKQRCDLDKKKNLFDEAIVAKPVAYGSKFFIILIYNKPRASGKNFLSVLHGVL